MQGGLHREEETVLLECFSYGAVNIGVFVSLGAVDEGGGRGMRADGVSDFYLWDASLE